MAAGAAAAGVAVAKFTKDGVRNFLDFDDAMTSSLAIMGDISGPMRKDMEAAARGIAKETRFSADQVAEGYFFLASAGLDAAQSIGALPQVAAFATAGNFDLARATDLATDAQSALGMTSGDAEENLQGLTRVTDVLVKANTLANASVEQFSTSLTNKAGAALRNLNKDMEEGVAVLGVFADQGIKGEQAGTMLTATLDGLSRNAINNSDEFERLGIQVFDADGNMRNMADIVGDLEGSLGGMSDEQKRAELMGLGFNKQALDGINALMGSSDAIREYESELRNAGGTTEEVADKQLESFAAQWDLAKSKITDVGISLGSFLVPKMAAAADWVGKNTGTVKILAGVLGGLAAVMLTVAAAQKVWMTLLAIKAGVVKAITVAQWLWNVAMSANPIGLIIIAIAALVAIIIIAYKRSETFRKIVDGAFRGIAAVVKWWWENIVKRYFAFWQAAIGLAVDAAKWLWDQVKRRFAAAKAIFSAVVGWVNNMWTQARDRFQRIVDFVRGIPGKIRSGLSTLRDRLMAPFRAAFNAVASLWNRSLGRIRFTVPDWVPKMGGRGWSFPQMPMLAEGGIVTRPTVALIGEAGPEAVVPLSRGGGVGAQHFIFDFRGVRGNPQLEAFVEQFRKAIRTNPAFRAEVRAA